MAYETIRYEVKDTIAHVALARPEVANTMNARMADELLDAALRLGTEDSVRAVLITADGAMFSGGGDLKAFLDAGEDVGRLLMHLTTQLHAAISILARLDAPVVTAVNGMAAGGGFSFAISGDYVIAGESARFTLAYTAAGLSPDGSSTFFLPRLVGLRRARELMLTNRRLSAAEALEYGLIDRVVPDAELGAAAGEQARNFAAGPTAAYGAVKRLLAGSFGESLETQMALESRSIAERAASPDGQEGIRSFVEKRKPSFRGQ